MIAVDASVAIGFLDPGDANHQRAVDLVVRAAPPLLIHPVTLAEVLVRPVITGDEEAVWSALREAGFALDPEPVDPFVLARLRARTGLKMPDCCVVATAESHRCRVGTLDERLRRDVDAAP